MTPEARRETLEHPDLDASEDVPRTLDPIIAGGEEVEEGSLRPRSLSEFVGQSDLVEHLEIVLQAARAEVNPSTTCSLRDRRASERPLWRSSWPRRWGWGCG